MSTKLIPGCSERYTEINCVQLVYGGEMLMAAIVGA